MAVEINGHEISGFLLMLDLAKSSQAGLDLPGWIPLTRFPLLDFAESTEGLVSAIDKCAIAILYS